MTKKLLLTPLLLVLFQAASFAQTEPSTDTNDKLEFSTGYTFGSLKNLEFSPVSRYDYNAFTYKLGYERTSKNHNLFNIRLAYLTTTLKSDRIPALNSDYSKIGLSFSYLKRIYNKNKLSIHLGLQSNTNISFSDEGVNSFPIFNQSFGIASQFTYQINEKHALYSKLTIPMLLFRLTDSSSDTFTLKRNQSIFWEFGYNYSLSNDFDLKASYQFNYDRLQIPNAFREVQYQFNLGVQYKF
ncbi:hypothetical protein [uncultured Kordia sp.]|uniref:hypothetical protein n=1 Tax=uncultured Kordia sp. TaxID=507699 RepID=UPI0026020085|nr:hypothetical protein [uncultured Kordia sp.]